MIVHSLLRKENVGTIDGKVVKENEFLQLLYQVQLVQIKTERYE